MIFISCHTLRGILNAQELFYFDWTAKDIANGCYGVKFWAMTLVPVSEFMLLINSCANFFLYYLFHKDFRMFFMKQKRSVCTAASNKKPSISNMNANFQSKKVDDSLLSQLKEKSYAKDSQQNRHAMQGNKI